MARAIRTASSDSFSADILRFCLQSRDNPLITNWNNINVDALKVAFAQRMRERYHPNDESRFDYKIERISAFGTWAKLSPQERLQEVAYFRERFRRNSLESGSFLAWVLPKDAAYQGNPLDGVEVLFPKDDLADIVNQMRDESAWSKSERQSVLWFMELMETHRGGGAQAV